MKKIELCYLQSRNKTNKIETKKESFINNKKKNSMKIWKI